MRAFVQKPNFIFFFKIAEIAHVCTCVCVCACVFKGSFGHTHDIFYSPKRLLKGMESSWSLCTKWVLLPSFLTYLLSFFPSTPISCVSRLYFNFWLVEIAIPLYTLMRFPFPPSTPTPFLAFSKPLTSPPKGGEVMQIAHFYHFW